MKKKYSTNLHIKKISLTAIFLSLALLTSFGTNFIKLAFLSDFLSLDISLIFIIPLIFICSYYWSSLAAIILSLITIFWPGNNWIGMLFNLIANFSFVTLIWLFYKILYQKIKNNFWYFGIVLFLSIIFGSFIFTVLNGVLFQPLWWWFFNILKVPSFIEAENLYNFGTIPKIFLLYIPNYWGGIFALYMSFNLFKFFIIGFILFPLIYKLIKNKLINNLFFKNSLIY